MTLTEIRRIGCVLALLGLYTTQVIAKEAGNNPAAAPEPPPPTNETSLQYKKLAPASVTYTASLEKGLALNGSATRTLEAQKDGTWLLRFNVDSFIADITETLHFRWQNNHVIPLRYRYQLSGLLVPDRKNSLDYDWDKSQVSGTIRGKRFTMGLPEGALDPLGYQFQLREDLRAGKTDMEYQVTDKARFETDRFAVIGREKLKTELGTLDTLKVEKVRAPDSKRETLMWFAPDRDYMLVKLVQFETDGTRYEINIKNADLAR